MENGNGKRMVKFLTNCSPYQARERATFPAIKAKRLVDRKIAVYDDDDAEVATTEVVSDDSEQNDGNEPESTETEKKPTKRKRSTKKRKRVRTDDADE